MSVQFFCPFFNWVIWVFLMLSYMSCLYLLDINPLLVISLASIFSFSVGYLYILFMVSSAMQKLLSLIRSHLLIFVFISFTLGDRSKKQCYYLYERIFCLCISLGVLWFVVLHLLHFEFIFFFWCVWD